MSTKGYTKARCLEAVTQAFKEVMDLIFTDTTIKEEEVPRGRYLRASGLGRDPKLLRGSCLLDRDDVARVLARIPKEDLPVRLLDKPERNPNQLGAGDYRGDTLFKAMEILLGS